MGAFYNSIVLTLDTQGIEDEASLLQAAARTVFEGWKRQEVPLGLVSQACVDRDLPEIVGKLPIAFNFIRHALSEFRIRGCSMFEIDYETLAPVDGSTTGVRIRWRQEQVTAFSGPMTVIVCDLAEELRVSMDVLSDWFDTADAADFVAEYVQDLRKFAAVGSNEAPAVGLGANRGLIYAADDTT